MVLSKSSLRDSGSTRQWRSIRSRILRRDQFICQYCNQEATTVDHVIPRRLGGLDSDDNLVSSCRRCNLAKGGRFFARDRTQIGRAHV
jgi:5-methylcytosine-specific restriction endonuclease McrA